MRSEEEKKAIELIKDKTLRNTACVWLDIPTIDSLRILVKLIEKQQKEINEAIEYIENAKKELYGCGNYYLSDLLNILKGE